MKFKPFNLRTTEITKIIFSSFHKDRVFLNNCFLLQFYNCSIFRRWLITWFYGSFLQIWCQTFFIAALYKVFLVIKCDIITAYKFLTGNSLFAQNISLILDIKKVYCNNFKHVIRSIMIREYCPQVYTYLFSHYIIHFCSLNSWLNYIFLSENLKNFMETFSRNQNWLFKHKNKIKNEKF